MSDGERLNRFLDLSPPASELEGRRAGIVSRGLAFVVDFGVIIGGYPLIIWGIGVVDGLLHLQTPTYPDLPDGVSLAIYSCWLWGYFTFSWFGGGRTIGQALVGLRVIGRRRDAIGPVRAAVRTWAMLATLFVVGPVWLVVAKSRLAIHDRVAGTQVVYAAKPRKTAVSMALGTSGAGGGASDVQTGAEPA